jgi:hypothetical protein
MSKFPNQPPTQYFGKTIISNGVPWHYLPVWIFLTTPLTYTFFFLAGVFYIFKKFFYNGIGLITREASFNDIQDLLFFGLCLGPIVTIILLKSIVYDGWRHVYFVYPFFLIIATIGIKFTLQLTLNYVKLKFLVSAILVTSMVHIFVWMIKAHPYQNIYFNFLAGSALAEKFDLDYGGTALRECLEYIARTSDASNIKIFSTGILNFSAGLDMLPQASRDRFSVVGSIDAADFVITNFRNDLKSYDIPPSGFHTYKNVVVHGEVIASIFKSN